MMSELNIGKCKNCGHEVMVKDDLIKHTNKDSAQHRYFTLHCQSCECKDPVADPEPNNQTSMDKGSGKRRSATREQVEELYRQGKTNKEIAEILHLSTPTVSYHLSNIANHINTRSYSHTRRAIDTEATIPTPSVENTGDIEGAKNTKSIEDQLVALTQVPKALTEIYLEYLRATSQFPQFASPHEGYAVLLEEVDELWDEIKNNKKPGAQERMRKEATQVAAMAMKFLMMLDEVQRDGFQ